MNAIREIVNRDGDKLILSIPSNIHSTKFEVVIIPLEELDTEEEWYSVISKNKAFDFLNDEAENIYSLKDGNPFDHKK